MGADSLDSHDALGQSAAEPSVAPQTVARRTVLGQGAAGATLATLAGGALAKPPHQAFRNSLCVSQFADAVFAKGLRYSSGKVIARDIEGLQRLMMAQGSTEVFARLGTRTTGIEKSDTQSGMSAAIDRARLARHLGLPLNPELLLCAFYGDESGQPEPDFSDYPTIKFDRPWRQASLEEICAALRTYGALAARQILDTGVKVSVWDIGNEVDLGIAGIALAPFSPGIGPNGWAYQPPDGVDPEIGRMTVAKFFAMTTAQQIEWGRTHLWGYVGKALAAVAAGIREVDPHARVATHLGGLAVQTPEVFVAIYQAFAAAGFAPDTLGASFYPTAHQPFPIHPGVDRPKLYQQTALLAKKQLGKPLYIAEFGYSAGSITYDGQSWSNPVRGYPATPKGQADFLRDLVAWGAANGTLAGIRPWAPDYVASGWQGMALFDAPVDGTAHARPGLAAIKEGLKRARR